jgi:hypothetical protein
MDQTLLRSIRMATLDLRCDLAVRRVIAALERCAGLSGTNHWETQPRDDHGRWTDGLGAGGAGDVSVEPVAGFDFEPVDLRNDEGYLGGYTIARHVGRSDEELIARVTGEANGGSGLSRPPVGSFSSFAVANMLVNAVLEKNLLFVHGVQSGVLRSAVIGAEFPFITGREAVFDRSNGSVAVREVRGVRVIVVFDESSLKRFRVHTAYPFTVK